jgi:predicted nucleic acid-binding protein
MSAPVYVLDACAMLAVLSKEQGYEKVIEVYYEAARGEVNLIMNKVNLLEVYYDLFRAYGKEGADVFITKVKQSPIIINHEITDEVFEEAGRLKATYKISLADSFALAQSVVSAGTLLTCDHHEFDPVAEKEMIDFAWIR